MDTAQDVTERIKEFYILNRISAHNFDCVSQQCCKEAAEHVGGEFRPVREVTFGENYLKCEPKIVVVSLDPGSLKEAEPLRIRKGSDEYLHKGRHWYRTHEGVAMIIEAATKRQITSSEAACWFAHTSVVRCSANLKKHAQAPWQMFRNCRDYLKREIEILAPDIIWTQGKEAYHAMSWVEPYVEETDRSSILQSIRRINFPHQGFWIHTYHPTARGGTKWGESKQLLQSLSNYLV